MELYNTLHATKRLTLSRDRITSFVALCITLDAFSIWGSADTADEHTISWEFSLGIKDEVIEQAVKRLGYSL